MKLGFSLSPGGLLLPYHAGVLASLDYNGVLLDDDRIPLAGSSAGSIAVVAQACGIAPSQVLDATIVVSDTCEALGGARGRLLPLLRHQLDTLVDEQAFGKLQERRQTVGVAYRELFPQNRSVLQTSFSDKDNLIQAVCHSCTFPFFATNWPVAMDTTSGVVPRILVDGFFSVPRDRFGCPDFEDMLSEHVQVDRTITVSPFPHALVGLEASELQDSISPCVDTTNLSTLYALATQSSSGEELTRIYENGMADAEAWLRQEERRDGQTRRQAGEEARRRDYGN